MVCDLCGEDKECISIDVEWTLLDTVCSECWYEYTKDR